MMRSWCPLGGGADQGSDLFVVNAEIADDRGDRNRIPISSNELRSWQFCDAIGVLLSIMRAPIDGPLTVRSEYHPP